LLDKPSDLRQDVEVNVVGAVDCQVQIANEHGAQEAARRNAMLGITLEGAAGVERDGFKTSKVKCHAYTFVQMLD